MGATAVTRVTSVRRRRKTAKRRSRRAIFSLAPADVIDIGWRSGMFYRQWPTCKRGAPAEPRQSTAAASVSVRLEKTHHRLFALFSPPSCAQPIVPEEVMNIPSERAAPNQPRLRRGDLFEDVFGSLLRVAPPPTSLSLRSATSPICRSPLRFFCEEAAAA